MIEALLTLISIMRQEAKKLILECLHEFQQLQLPIEVKDDKIERLFSIADLCKLFGVSRVTIGEWKKSGKLPYVKMGGRIYFQEFSVMTALEKYDMLSKSSFLKNKKGTAK